MDDRQPRWRSTLPEVGAFLVIVLSGCVIALELPAARATAPAAAPATAHEAVAPSSTRTPDPSLCAAVSTLIGNSAAEVERYRHDGRPERILRLRTAEGQLLRYSERAEPALREAVRDMGNAIGGLRSALESGGDVGAATDVALRRIDALEAACARRPAPET